ncbi:MAG TPA: sialidase family protein [Kofleriaceae bacterium]|nr:sialidase family protein [Kofleriaceae bacterium]
MARRVAILFSLAALAACGSDGGGDGGDDPGADAAPGADAGDDGCEVVPSDVTCEGIDGAWVFENVSRTADTISHDGDLALSAGGAMRVAFAEPLADPIFDQDILIADRGECGWQASTPMTSDTEVQNAYPSLAVEGDTFHLVWSGYPEGLNDVYYSADSGAGWTQRVNLTAEYESSMMRHAYAPSISIGPGGAVAIAYLSAPADPEGGFAGPAEVRVALLEADTLAGPPVTVIPATGDGCFDPRAAHDGNGQLHVLAECGPVLDQDIVWATDDGPGPWQSEPLPGTAGHGDLSVTVTVTGGTLHAAWAADLPCGEDTCRTLQYSTLDGASWSTPVSASLGGAPSDFAPSLAVAEDGTVYIAFWRDNAEGKSDVLLTSSADGETFTPPCNLTRTAADNEWMPSALQLDPAGKLHLLYEQFVPASDPLDTEIIHGRIL